MENDFQKKFVELISTNGELDPKKVAPAMLMSAVIMLDNMPGKELCVTKLGDGRYEARMDGRLLAHSGPVMTGPVGHA